MTDREYLESIRAMAANRIEGIDYDELRDRFTAIADKCEAFDLLNAKAEAKVSLPERVETELAAMLEAYFEDDSQLPEPVEFSALCQWLLLHRIAAGARMNALGGGLAGLGNMLGGGAFSKLAELAPEAPTVPLGVPREQPAVGIACGTCTACQAGKPCSKSL